MYVGVGNHVANKDCRTLVEEVCGKMMTVLSVTPNGVSADGDQRIIGYAYLLVRERSSLAVKKNQYFETFMRSRNIRSAPRPDNPSGNLYYVRLKTPNGTYYKLGFTKRDTVEERLGFQGNSDKNLIDKVFLFAFRQDAFDVEQRLHSHFLKDRLFGKFGDFPHAPLYKNGQSELYAVDILGLDAHYTEKQRDEAIGTVRQIGGKQVAIESRIVSIVVPLIYFPLMIVIKPLVWFYRLTVGKEAYQKEKVIQQNLDWRDAQRHHETRELIAELKM
jgi:hypothetical protein